MDASKAKRVRARATLAAGAVALLAMLIGLAGPARGTGGAAGLLAADEAPPRLDVAAAIGAAEVRLGERYGGAWIERSSGSAALKVAVAGSGDRAALAAGSLAVPGVELVSVKRSLAELERARDQALDALPGSGSGSPLAIDADPRRGAVVVSGDGLDRAAQERIERAAGAPVVFESEDGLSAELVKEACFFCYPPWRAALPIRSGRALCTGAFTVYQGKRRKHKFRALSAGHCQTNRRTVHVGRRKVGRITANSFRGKRRIAADALRFRVPRKHRRAQLATPQYGDVPVIGKLPNRALVRGAYVCFSGRTTGGGCGYIGRSDISLRLGGKIFTHLWCAEIATRPGDSGGPVVQPRGDGGVRAVGLVGISLQTPSSDEMCFSSINLALKKMSVRLLSAGR